MKKPPTTPSAIRWYREPTMQLVAGVLLSTLISGMAMLSLAISGNDPLIVSDDQYQQIRDDFRLTQPRQESDE
ncbi:MAG: hypothetical protein AB8B96_03115 [Lysobacterales bacterium]